MAGRDLTGEEYELLRVECGKSGQGKYYWNSKLSIKPNKSLLNEAIIFKKKEEILVQNSI